MEDIKSVDLEKSSNASKSGTASTKGSKRSQAGKQNSQDLVEVCMKAYEDEKRPRKLGRMFAFWYNGKNEPRIVIGPDFGFSLLELALTNGILSIILNSARSQGLLPLLYCGLGILLIHNGAFIATVMRN